MAPCPTCGDSGWTCEKHPGQKWPHAKSKAECSALGVPCDCPKGTYALALRAIFQKLDRANQYIGKVDTAIKVFVHEDTDASLPYEDLQSKEALQQQQRDRVVPLRFSIDAGEILYHIRSALDHMACTLILYGGGSLTTKSAFPMELYRPVTKDDLRRYEGKVKGMPDEALRAVEGYQPYHAGHGRDRHPLAVLRRLNDADKHRALNLHSVMVRPTVHLTIGAVDPNGTDWQIDSVRLDESAHSLDPGLDSKVEIVDVKRQLVPYVAFKELAGRDDIPVIDTLAGILFHARRIVLTLSELIR